MGEIFFSKVTKDYNKVRALSELSFTVKDGEFLTLLGPSGCGKTTILNLIAGIILPTQGEIFINRNMMNNIPVHKRNIGFVFQSYSLFPHMTVFDNVAFGLKMKKHPKKEIPRRVEEALHLVNMDGYESRRPSELSGGQQQRIALARALVFNPDVLLLDEPLSNLDAKLRESVRFEIMQLHKKTKKTVVFVTHDQIEALTMSDRIILMNEGRIEQIGTPAELYSNPKTVFAAGFIGANSFIGCKVESVLNDRVKVNFNGNVVMCNQASPEGLACGEDAVLAIRPEKLCLLNPENRGEYQNALTGKLVNVVFQGADTLLYLDLEGTALKVCMVNGNQITRNGPRDFTLNETITVGFNDCMVFPRLG